MKLTFFNISGSLLRVTLSAMMILYAVFATGCAEDYNPPSEPIFSDVELIEIESPLYKGNAGLTFQYSVPDSVSDLVFCVFEKAWGDSVQHIGNSITEDMDGGTNSIDYSMSMSTVSKNDLLEFDPLSQSFTSTPYSYTEGTQCHIVILGLDGNFNVIAASPDWEIEW